MSLTEKARKMHVVYENASTQERKAVDMSVHHVMMEFGRNNLPTAHDDRAEELAAAIMEYLLASKVQP